MREPRAFEADDPDVTTPEPEAAPAATAAAGNPADSASLPRTDGAAASLTGGAFGWGAVLVGALISLMLLAAGLWVERFVSVALAREDWLGWVALGWVGRGWAGLGVMSALAT